MSLQAQSAVINHSQATGSEYLVLLMLANHAHADGTGAYPSVSTLAREARVGIRTCQEAIKRLIQLGELQRELRAGPRGVNVYHICLPGMVRYQEPSVASDPADSAGVRAVAPRSRVRETPQTTASDPAESAPKPSLTVIEPSGTPAGVTHTRASHTRPAPKPGGPKRTVQAEAELPAGWWPTPQMLSEAGVRYPDRDLRAETERFVLWHGARKTRRADWNAEWWLWLTNPARAPASANGHGSPLGNQNAWEMLKRKRGIAL